MKISLLVKVAFICNICLLLTILLKYYSFLPDGDFKNTIAVLGYGASFVINTLVNGWILVLYFTKKLKEHNLPSWLLIANGLIFILQIYLLLK